MTDAFKTHPQPRTFAPSKEDVLQNLQYFFGAPVSPEKLKVSARILTPNNNPNPVAHSDAHARLLCMLRTTRSTMP